MSLSDNEKYLRDLLGDGTEDLDMEALWDAVEPRLDKKKKRRGIIFWFLGTGLLFSFLGITFTIWYQTKETASHSTSTINQQHTENNFLEKDDLNTSSIENENNIKDKNNRVEDNGVDLSTDKKTTVMLDYENDESKPLSSLLVNKYDINFYNLNQGNISNSNHSEEIIETITSSYMEENNTEAVKEELNSNEKDSVIERVGNQKEEEIKDDLVDKEEKEKEKKKTTTKKKKTSKKKRKKRKKWSPYFYTSASLAYPARMLSSRNGEGIELLDIKREYEKSLESYQFAMNFKSIHKKNNLILNIGVNYENITERLKYQEEIVETEMQTVTESIIVDAQGNLIAQESGVVEITTITKRDVSIYNYYRFVNLQLGVGYRIEQRKFNIEYEAGLDFNVFFNAKGSTFNKDLQVIDLSRSMKQKAVNPSLWTSLSLDYPLNKQVSFTGSVYIKYRPGSITQKEHEIKHQFFSPGISGGMKFLIF